jgi:hypothetical protein
MVAARSGVREAAIVAVLLYARVRVEECGRLEIEDVAITARIGTRISAWLDERSREPGPLWTGQRGPLTDFGIT